MNYVRELNAFYEWLELNPLPSHAIALWHSLMAVCNKAGWLDEFTVANGTLQVRAGVSRKQLNDSRALLVDKGRIEYKKAKRANEAGKYRIVSFGTQEGTQTGTRDGTQEGTRLAHRTVHETGTLVKQNKTKHSSLSQNKSAHVEEVSPVDIIEGHMQVKMVNPQYVLKGNDYHSVIALLEQHIPTSFILDEIDGIFERYRPKSSLDRIRNFAYCAPGIEQKWVTLQERKNANYQHERVDVRHESSRAFSDASEYDESVRNAFFGRGGA